MISRTSSSRSRSSSSATLTKVLPSLLLTAREAGRRFVVFSGLIVTLLMLFVPQKFVVKWIAGSRYTITSQALTWNVGANNEVRMFLYSVRSPPNDQLASLLRHRKTTPSQPDITLNGLSKRPAMEPTGGKFAGHGNA